MSLALSLPIHSPELFLAQIIICCQSKIAHNLVRVNTTTVSSSMVTTRIEHVISWTGRLKAMQGTRPLQEIHQPHIRRVLAVAVGNPQDPAFASQ